MRAREIIGVLLLVVIAASCDISIKGSQINKPTQLQIVFTKQSNNTFELCFELEMPKSEQVYLLRLDYYPFQCLDARNDAKLQWNPQKQLYSVAITVKRQCKKRTLFDDEQEPYKMIYEFRQGYDKGGILAHNQLVHKYLPTLLILFIVSVIAQRLIFRSLPGSKNKAH